VSRDVAWKVRRSPGTGFSMVCTVRIIGDLLGSSALVG
jgi:hypothetical protein